MNKKILGLALAIGLIIPTALSARAFDFNIGATAQFQNNVSADDFDASDLTDIDNYSFGAEARFNFLLLEIANTALIGTEPASTQTGLGTSDFFTFENNLAAGIYTDVLDTVRLGLLAGPEFKVYVNDSGAYSKDSNGVYQNFVFTDIFMESNFAYKAHADILLGKALTLSASYTLPTSFNLNDGDFSKLAPSSDDWENGKVAISLLLL
jgi:hypothetical protein